MSMLARAWLVSNSRGPPICKFSVCIHINEDFCVGVSQGFLVVRMKFLTRISLSLLALPVSAFATNAVVNMSHYDLMRADFGRMKYEGIVGVIHEATYPAFVRDSYYSARQQAATRAGLL